MLKGRNDNSLPHTFFFVMDFPLLLGNRLLVRLSRKVSDEFLHIVG